MLNENILKKTTKKTAIVELKLGKIYSNIEELRRFRKSNDDINTKRKYSNSFNISENHLVYSSNYDTDKLTDTLDNDDIIENETDNEHIIKKRRKLSLTNHSDLIKQYGAEEIETDHSSKSKSDDDEDEDANAKEEDKEDKEDGENDEEESGTIKNFKTKKNHFKV